MKLTQIKEFELDDNKGCIITGGPGTGKMCKGLQKEILNSVRHYNCYKVCAPTHKSALIAYVVKTDFSAKGPHFSAKRKIFPLTVKDAERALFARIQLGRSWARYPGRPCAFFGEPHVDVT
jgi:hypothetical protein